MNKELKQLIIKWLLDNEKQWQRVNSCRESFRNYIYDNNGDYIIGGVIVSKFITEANELIYD